MLNPRIRIIAALAGSYFVFAILLNSVGTVILQSISSFDITKPQASTLEGFKDLSIAILSFLVASFIPKAGYKKSLICGLIAVAIACLMATQLPHFWMMKLLFAVIGMSFALIKISVYSVIGQLADDAKGHSSLMNTIEGVFMLGVLSGYWFFAGFIDAENPASLSWLNVYYLLAGLSVAVALLVALAPITTEPNQSSVPTESKSEFLDMLRLTYKPLVLIFIISVFLYVLIEQGIGTWLPTFNREVLSLPAHIAVQITSIFAASLAAGRLAAGQLLRFIGWPAFLNVCLVLMAILILITMPLANTADTASINSLFDAPLAAFMLPMIGLLMAPIYPIINSVMLSALAKHQQSAMTGLIVVFSALGGTTGSIITGLVFSEFGGQNAFYLLLIPIASVAIALRIFAKTQAKYSEVSNAAI